MMSNGVTLNHTERLYLSKHPNDEVFVDSCENLHQHQLDGVRFLFKQFKKQKPGVIVNCPSACGKSVLVAVFLQVVQKLIKEPVLILCNQEDEMLYWRETCFRWTQFVDDDLIIESSNANTKNKKIFLKTITEFPSSYLRRKWSIVIYKDDIITKNMSKLIIQSDFKIWLTSMDMLKDLPMLLFIYTWINPKSNLNIDEFQSSKDAKEQLKNVVRLETFLEDILYKNNDMKAFNSSEKLATVENKDLKRSRKKNKDATGTKIKKSKPKTDIKLFNTVTAVTFEDKNLCVVDVKQEMKCDSNSGSKLPSNMEVDTFSLNEIKVGLTNDYTNNRDVNEDNEFHTPPMNFDNALKDLIDNENNISQSLIKDEVTLPQNEINDKFINAQITPLATNKTNDFSSSITTDNIMDTSVLEDTGNISTDKDTVKIGETKGNNSEEINNDVTIEESLLKSNDISIVGRKINDKVDISEGTVLNESVTSDLKAKTTPEKMNEFTSKIHELEKQTLKKFKGSLLDSLF